MRSLILASVLLCASPAHADEDVVICYNYGCASKAWVKFSEAQLGEVRGMIGGAADAPAERAAIAQAVGRMYLLAGRQSPIWRDRGGNYDDDEADGRMDCIDHSTNTTSWLSLFARRGWLKFHSVLPEVKRGFWAYHAAARVAERATRREFAVDSWFFDNGHPAVIFPLRDWMDGARANDK